jgi:hypothetical protein
VWLIMAPVISDPTDPGEKISHRPKKHLDLVKTLEYYSAAVKT